MSGRWSRFFRDTMVRDSGIVFLGSCAANLCHLFFWLYMVRHLAAEAYGTLNTLVSVIGLLGLPFAIQGTALARFASRLNALDRMDELNALARCLLTRMALAGLGALVLLAAARGPIAGYLKMDDPGLVVWAGGVVFAGALGVFAINYLTGLQDFAGVSLVSVFSGILKLVFGIALVAWGAGVVGGLGAFLVAGVAAAFLGIARVPVRFRRWRGAVSCPVRKEADRYLWAVALSMGAFFLLTNLDVILVKHYFTPEQAGHYSVAQTLGKIVLFFASAVGIVLLPKVAQAQAVAGAARKVLARGLVLVGGLTSGIVLLAVVAPQALLKLLSGRVDAAALRIVPTLALAMGFLSLGQVVMLYHLSLHRMRFLYFMTAAAAGLFAGIAFFHEDLIEVARVLLAVSAGVFAAGCLFTWSRE